LTLKRGKPRFLQKWLMKKAGQAPLSTKVVNEESGASAAGWCCSILIPTKWWTRSPYISFQYQIANIKRYDRSGQGFI
jgi:hypothetical protein